MPEPILVVHGVANRDPALFKDQVAKLQRHLDTQWQLVPVFWGDLGGSATDILDVLPKMDDEVRGLQESQLPAGLMEALFAQPSLDTHTQEKFAVRSLDARQDHILRGVSQAHPERNFAVRSQETDAIAEAVREELPQTRFLNHVQSPEVLEAVGRALGEVVAEPSLSMDGSNTIAVAEPAPLVRSGAPDSPETRGVFDALKQRAKKALAALDELIGKTVGDVVGNFNQRLRGAIAEPFVRFFGDIFAYQRNQNDIQSRLWEAIATWERENGSQGRGWGTAQRPIHVIAHSLGGVVCFDAAVREDNPLHMKSFLTFGSQAGFFHIVDPRQTLTRYSREQPVTLPGTIPRWTSLWDTMDFLAFTAGNVFQYPNGQKPQDIRVNDPISLILADKGWTHSIYWETEELVQALKDILRP